MLLFIDDMIVLTLFGQFRDQYWSIFTVVSSAELSSGLSSFRIECVVSLDLPYRPPKYSRKWNSHNRDGSTCVRDVLKRFRVIP